MVGWRPSYSDRSEELRVKRIVQAVLGAAGLGVLMLVFAAPASAVSASPSASSFDCTNDFPLSALTVTGPIGSQFAITNSSSANGSTCFVLSMTGVVTATGLQSGTPPYIYKGTTATFTIVDAGTFTITTGGASAGSATVTVVVGDVQDSQSTQTPPTYEFTYWLPGTPAVECGPLRQTVVSGTQVSLPGADADCKSARSGLVGWSVPGSTEVFAPGAQVIVSGDQKFTAEFADPSMWFTQNSNVGSGVPCYTNGQSPGTSFVTTLVLRTEVKLGMSAPCAPAGLSLKGWNTKGDGTGTTYAPGATVPAADVATQYRLHVYAVWGAPALVLNPVATTVQTGATGTITVRDPGMAGQSVSVAASGAVTLASGAPSTVTIGADGAASVSFVAGAAAGTGTVTASAGGVAASAAITVTKPAQQTMVIVGERTTVSGKPGVRIDGQTTGLAPGSAVVPWFRFPGQVTYSQGSARPVVQSDGSFTWQRKTGKKLYAYVTFDDGKVQSNRVIIAAN